MNVLFVSLTYMKDLEESNIYSDLLKEFIVNGHHLDIISPIQERDMFSCEATSGDGFCIYYTRIGNVTNTPFVEKGVSVLKVGNRIIDCIKRNIGSKTIDLLLIAVPPVTYDKVVCYVKNAYNAKVYLLLKDIWPASMFDLKTPGGPLLKAIVSSVFRHWEKRLYRNSDMIGCLSEGNVKYVLENNRYLSEDKVEVNPNVITPRKIKPLTVMEKDAVRIKHGIPTDRMCFVYGGTLGVGQNVSHIVKCLRACKDLKCHFVISGRGVQYSLLEDYLRDEKPTNLTLINGLPKPEYELMMQSCDVGLVFLRYTAQTPNIPSRILSYMEYSLPVFSCVDPVSDLTQIVEEGNFGWGCLSNDENKFREKIIEAMHTDLALYSKNSRNYLEQYYCASVSYKIIMESCGKE